MTFKSDEIEFMDIMAYRIFPFSATLRPSGKGSLRLTGNFSLQKIAEFAVLHI